MRRIDENEIDEIEAAALNAWPAAQQYLLDGYVVRFAQGYTKRANSVNRLRPPRIAPAELVPLCEDLYRARGLLSIFRLIDSAESAALDGFLAQRGYQMLDQTVVMTCAAAVAADGAAAPQGAFTAQFVQMELDDWLDAYMQLSQAARHTRAAHRAILQAIVPPRLFAALVVDGGAAGVRHGRARPAAFRPVRHRDARHVKPAGLGRGGSCGRWRDGRRSMARRRVTCRSSSATARHAACTAARLHRRVWVLVSDCSAKVVIPSLVYFRLSRHAVTPPGLQPAADELDA